MNLLILSVADQQVAFYATPTPDALRAEIGKHRDIEMHYVIPFAQAPSVVRYINRTHAGKLAGAAPPWYVMSMTEAIGIASLALQKNGANAFGVRGGMRMKSRREQVAA